jgi:hypothetical protein
MVLQIFPEPTSSSLNADSYTVPAALRRYKVVKNFDAAVYTITTSPTSSQATVIFQGASTLPSTTTVSGAITYNLSVAATGAYIYIDTGTDIVVTINKVAAALSGAEMSGTLDTITSTGTYNQTGLLYVLAVGGGSGGGGSYSGASWSYGGGGGAASVPVGGMVYVNAPTSVTIGAQGLGAASYASEGNAGGTTNFGNLFSSTGGVAVGYAGNGAGGGGRSGGQPGENSQGAGNATAISHPTVINGSNGGGGAGYTSSGNGVNVGGSGAGSGIGTGGTGGGYSGNAMTVGSAATGYGAGGGGGGSKGYTPSPYGGVGGGHGSPGVVYVLRGF